MSVTMVTRLSSAKRNASADAPATRRHDRVMLSGVSAALSPAVCTPSSATVPSAAPQGWVHDKPRIARGIERVRGKCEQQTTQP